MNRMPATALSSREVRDGPPPRSEAAEALRLELQLPPRVEGSFLRLTGVLTNPTAEPIPIVYSPGGLFVSLRPSADIAWYGPDDPDRPKHLPPPMPPVPPPPFAATIPALTEVVFEAHFWLEPLRIRRPTRATVDWSFGFLNRSRLAGTFELELP